MLIYLLFLAIAVILDYMANTARGTFVAFWLAVIAIGVLVIGLNFLVAHTYTAYPQQIITSSAGNTIIPALNITSTQTNATQSFAFLLGELLVFIQFAYMFLMLSYVFSERKRKKYEE